MKWVAIGWLICCSMLCGVAGESFFPGGVWEFNGDLNDSSGNELHGRGAVSFNDTAGGGMALCLDGDKVFVSDSPLLRLERGIELATRVRLDKLPPGNSWYDLVMKGEYHRGEYVLRLNPAKEGSTFGFFVNTGVWERRVNSKQVAEPGRWYDIAAGWDSEGLWIKVDGELVRTPRDGVPVTTREPLRIGAFEGEVEFLRVSRPAESMEGVGFWPLLSNGKSIVSDRYGWDIDPDRFSTSAEDSGLIMKSEPLYLPDDESFHLAPGLRVECLALFNELPEKGAIILMKDGEYMLRLDPAREGNSISFFISIDDRWEPRVFDDLPVERGKWHRISAGWDGSTISLSVNDRVKTMYRSGAAAVKGNPLRVGNFDGVVRNLVFENPKPLVVNVKNIRTHATLLHAGERFEVSGEVVNYSSPVTGCVATITLPQGLHVIGERTVALPPLGVAIPQSIGWVLRADTGMVARATIGVELDGEVLSSISKRLAIHDLETEFDTAQTLETSGLGSGVTYYIDSRGGNNSNDGQGPERAWRNFSHINGRTLGAGDRLLLRAGSVFNQELSVGADGRADAWVEIGAYGDGPRPVIRRNRDIDERCILIKNANYLAVRGLTLCFAGKGLIAHYDKPGCRGLLIEECIAHHIEGIYRFNSHGIPEWLNRRGAPGDNNARSAGFAVSGLSAAQLVFRDCEMFQCSQGFYMAGDQVLVERVFCHDNYTYNTSPHPVMANITRSVLQSSIFDAAGWHAHAGTMGIMLGNPKGFIIRNCHFLNQPDSGSSDQGGVDFEATGDGCLIDQCTFRNNAGAAIEVLGLRSPQTQNVEIRNSRFFRNNTALKLGPSEIFIWGSSRMPEVCCSTGVIRDNGYVLYPGVEFFTNQAPETTVWELHDNREYGDIDGLERAMPFNNPPQVEVKREIWSVSQAVNLEADIDDDGRSGRELLIRWEQLHGPGEVLFAESDRASTLAHFERAGDYTVRIVADDGELWRSAQTAVHILDPEVKLLKAWGFEEVLDKQGWEASGLNTAPQKWGDGFWSCIAKPVNYVAGGYYIFAMDESRDVSLVSPDMLEISLQARPKIVIMLQNSTNVQEMRVEFTTEAEPEWSGQMGKTFKIKAHDSKDRRYTFDLGSIAAWSGTLKQLRFKPAGSEPVTGTMRVGYIYIYH